MKVYVVDNGGQWTHREWRVLKYLKVETKIVPNNTPFEDLAGLDGLVLSGGSPSVACDSNRMGFNDVYLDKADFPILGICAGMQFMCQHFGSDLGPAKVPEFGEVKLRVTDHSGIFEGVPDEFTVVCSHNDEVKQVPEGFKQTATSETCPIEGVESLERPMYGIQFHPEVENTEHGVDIFRNFLDIIKGRKN